MLMGGGRDVAPWPACTAPTAHTDSDPQYLCPRRQPGSQQSSQSATDLRVTLETGLCSEGLGLLMATFSGTLKLHGTALAAKARLRVRSGADLVGSSTPGP